MVQLYQLYTDGEEYLVESNLSSEEMEEAWKKYDKSEEWDIEEFCEKMSIGSEKLIICERVFVTEIYD